MRLTTLGTGTVALSPARVCAGHFLQAGACNILLDCGSGVSHRLAETGLPWRDITHVALTHFHLDHFSDFATIAYGWTYGAIPGRSAPLVLIGPEGISDLFERVIALFGEWLRDPGFSIEIRQIAPGETLDIGDGVHLTAFKVPHTAESVAYSITRGHGRVVYTGDTGYDPMFGEWALGADLLLCECSLPSSMAIPEHLTPERCGALAAAALPKHLVLTHLYPPVEEVNIRGIVATHYAGPITVATDGAMFDIEEQ